MDGRMHPAKIARPATVFGLALLLIAWLPASGRSTGMDAPGKGLLDGKTFVVGASDAGSAGSEKDTLVFKDGNFRSLSCDKYEFGDGAYTAAEKDGAVYFEARTKSPSKGTMLWKGTVRGDRIESTYTWLDSSHWYKPNPKPVEKALSGELKKP